MGILYIYSEEKMVSSPRSTVLYDSYSIKIDDAVAVATIRVSLITQALTIGDVGNIPSTGTKSLPIQFRVGGGKRKLGPRACYAVVRYTGTDGTYLTNSYHRIPLLNSAIQGAATLATSATAVAYGGVDTWQFIDFGNESINGEVS
jgi:hypothetical protein